MTGSTGTSRRLGRAIRKLVPAALLMVAACSSGPDRAPVGRAWQAAPPPTPYGAVRPSRSMPGVHAESPRRPRAASRVTLVPPGAFREVPGYQAVGTASWYGRRYHGRRTASGEPFDMYAATAAHPTLPFGTLVRVTNMVNGRSVVLRINDRGPFVRRRIIDVSRGAAEALGFVRAGTTRVRVRLVRHAPG